LSMTGFVSAQANLGEQIVNFVNEVVKTIEPLAKYIVGESVETAQYSAGTLLFAKILFLVLIFSLIYLALTNIDFFNYNKLILWIICIAASILSTRFLGNDIVPAILIPYNTLGVFLTAGIPLILAFFVIERGMAGSGNKLIRRVAWIFFAVIFIGLWFSYSSSATATKWVWIYPATAAIALIMMWMDGTIQGFFNQMALQKASAMGSGTAIIQIEKLIADIREQYAKQGAGYTQHFPSKPNVKGEKAFLHDLKELGKRKKTLMGE
ncbi:MAG: hypothetical protein QXS38_02410, partial [Candidatus Pacearchaeota archaeon]